MQTLRFFMPMVPPRTTAQQHRILKTGRVVPGEKVTAAKQKLIAHLYQHRPDVPFLGPVQLSVVWKWEKPKQKTPYQWKVTRPDTDNLQKLLKDCMTRLGFWKDDAQVCDEHVIKLWTNTVPGIYITVTALEKFTNGNA